MLKDIQKKNQIIEKKWDFDVHIISIMLKYFLSLLWLC